MNLIKMDGFFHPSQVKGAVHIIGCGAVGSSIAFILAHCGVTNFVLYDDDTVESHNIANQMFREKDIGRPKVEALRDILVEINPEVADEIRIVNGKYVDQPLSGYVFLCVDSVAVRKAIAQSQQYNPRSSPSPTSVGIDGFPALSGELARPEGDPPVPEDHEFHRRGREGIDAPHGLQRHALRVYLRVRHLFPGGEQLDAVHPHRGEGQEEHGAPGRGHHDAQRVLK